MPDRDLVLTPPLAATAPVHPAQLSPLVAADALVRGARASGRPLERAGTILGGGHGAQYAVEQDLVREGLDRDALGVEAFVERLRSAEEEGRGRVAALLGTLGVGLDPDAATAAAERAARAAQVAFVRLFDAGLVTEAERVVDVCPRCATVVGSNEPVAAELDVAVLTLGLTLTEGDGAAAGLAVRTAAPELLPGVVAVSVPEGHPAAGASAVVPLVGTVVPVLAGAGGSDPTLVVPAHDAAAFETARRAGLWPVPVVDERGTVRSAGPLDGLPRHAARATAHRLLEAEAAVVAAEDGKEPVGLCPHCRTVLVPRLGHHWFLAMADLEAAVAGLVRDGTVRVVPPSLREDLLASAGRDGDWVLDRQVWAGPPVPVGMCRDCGHPDVSLDLPASCRRCMGHLERSPDVLDERFTAAVWPLAELGWPEADRAASADVQATLVVAAADLSTWVLPAAALALRLTGVLPFRTVSVVPPAAPGAVAPAAPLPDVAALVAREGRAVVRTALLCGGLDVDGARELVERIERPAAGSADVGRLAEAVGRELAGAAPASALGLLAAAVREGVAPPADGVAALAAPFLGE